MQAFVPKNRKPKFDLTLRIIDLTNIPLICGTAYVKWHLPSSSAAEHRGKTDRALIRDHKATWDYVKEQPVRLTMEKTQVLQECEIQFEILQEYHEGGRGGRVHLGNVTLNLAEYTRAPELPVPERDPQDDNDDGSITRRYLMQDSKINSTLKIGIKMKQIEGDTNFIAPPLKSAIVMSGIAGIITTESGEGADMPSISSKTRELSEAQDIYRRTLAATWACRSGELPPDKLIEDLFAGGDGGRMQPPPTPTRSERTPRRHIRDESADNSSSDADSRRTIRPRHLSPGAAARHGHGHHGHRRGASSGDASTSHTSQSSSISGRTSIEQQMKHSQRSHRRREENGVREPTEFDLREDLRSWQVRVN